jgi:hypothetical protein
MSERKGEVRGTNQKKGMSKERRRWLECKEERKECGRRTYKKC